MFLKEYFVLKAKKIHAMEDVAKHLFDGGGSRKNWTFDRGGREKNLASDRGGSRKIRDSFKIFRNPPPHPMP